MNLRKYTILFVIIGALFVGSAFAFGTYWGYSKQTHAETIAVIFGSSEDDIPENIDLTLILKAWKLIDEKYPFEDKPDSEARLWGAISGLVGSIEDPYSSFLPPQEAEIFSEDISGNFGGVGMEVGLRDGILTVISPLKNTPAERAGLLPGDRIIEVDDESTAQLSVDEAVLKIRGEIGTDVKLTIFREDEDLEGGGETLDVVITRDKITIPTIETDIEGDVYIISLFNFNGSSTKLFAQALAAFADSDYNKLVIDLRGNPGGFLDAAIDTTSYFVPQGKVIVKEDFGEKREEVVHRSKGFDVFDNAPEIVVLVNEGSASASEIFAAALQEHDIATVVGQQTFGKGSVQELVPFTNDTYIKITVAKWLTPDGNSIDDGGVTPDIIVEMDTEDVVEGNDPQLEKALEILNN